MQSNCAASRNTAQYRQDLSKFDAPDANEVPPAEMNSTARTGPRHIEMASWMKRVTVLRGTAAADVVDRVIRGVGLV